MNTMAKIVGAKPIEVAIMNSLTVNLHLMMTTFYRPNAQRFKIIIEGKAFPSDVIAVESQIREKGFNPDDALVKIATREGENNLRTEDIIEAIREHRDNLALVLLGI